MKYFRTLRMVLITALLGTALVVIGVLAELSK